MSSTPPLKWTSNSPTGPRDLSTLKRGGTRLHPSEVRENYTQTMAKPEKRFPTNAEPTASIGWMWMWLREFCLVLGLPHQEGQTFLNQNLANRWRKRKKTVSLRPTQTRVEIGRLWPEEEVCGSSVG